tara:strand:+ start:410 stop:919 length:510 start_codon:yes stop_codon:yes gene_type:complete
MQKINLSLKNVTAIPVTKALRALKGDYILVEEDGSTSVVPSAVFKAMNVLQGHRQNSAPKVSIQQQPKAQEKRNHVWPQVEAALKNKGALTTAQLAKIVDVPFKDNPSGARSYIGGLCRSMKKRNVLESVKVDAPNVRGDIRALSLWDFKRKTGSFSKTDWAALIKGNS